VILIGMALLGRSQPVAATHRRLPINALSRIDMRADALRLQARAGPG